MRGKTILVMLLLLAALLAGAPVQAAPPGSKPRVNKRARLHFRQGTALFKKQLHARALQQFKRAYKLDARPEMLFNIGLCQQRLGQLREALESYGLYLYKKPDATNYDKVRARIHELASEFVRGHQAALAALATRPDPAPAVAPVPAPVDTPAPPATPKEPPNPQPPGPAAEPGAPSEEAATDPQSPLGEPGEASAPASAPAAATQSQPAGSQPAASGSLPYWSHQQVAQGGVVLRLQVGPSGDVGGGSGSDELEPGYHLGFNGGFQFRLGQRHGIAPELALYYSSWGIDGVEGSASMLNVAAGARYSLYLGRIDLWGAAHLGFGNLSLTYMDGAVERSNDASGFAVSFGAGANFMILRYLGAGLYLRVSKAVVDRVMSYEFSATGLSLGLNVLGKIPL